MWNIFIVSTLLLLMSLLHVSAKDASLKEAMQQSIRITGTVTDNNGNLLPGVTIIVKGTTQGTITDTNGAYSIMVPNENVELVFSYVGFISQEFLVGKQRTINVSMTEDTQMIDEVIVVGYGTRVKGELTGSVSNVRGESLQAIPSGDLVKGLSGRLTGVTINDRGGDIGLSSSAEGNIRIRGSNTLGDNSPLIIIDGVPRSGISRLSANDIESISVLKDASAAIYGARAANGVIVIQTKRGTKSEANQIRLSSDFGIQKFTRIPEAMNSWEFATYMNEIADRFTTQKPYTQEDIELFKNGSNPITHPSTNWYDEVFRSYAPQSHHNITLSGGMDKVQYFVSGDYLNQKGMYRSNVKNYDQFQLRSNIDMTFVKFLKVGFDLNGRYGKDYGVPNIGRIMDRIWRTYPTEGAYAPDGRPLYSGELGQNPVVLSSDASGFLDQEQKVFNTKLSFDLDMPWLTQGISLSGYAAFDFNVNSSKQLNNPYDVWRLNKGTGEYTKEVGSDQSWGAITRLSQSISDYKNSLLHMRLSYLNSFGNHNINAFIAYEQSESISKYMSGVRRNLFSAALPELFAGEEEGRQVDGSSDETGRVNYFGSISYNYDRKYLIDFTLRRDGSFNFPKDKRFGNFPGVSIAWVPTNESFMPKMNWLNNLKLRTSWAIMGNDRISSFQYLAKYILGGNSWYVFGEPAMYNRGLDESTFPNKNITWEIADLKNIGFDATLLSSRMNFSLEYFYGKRSKILIQRSASTPGYTAITLPAENLGKVNNQGVEAALNYNDKRGDFSYQFGGNFTFNRNKIVYMDEAASVPEWRKQEGFPMNSFVVYENLGVYQTQEEVDNSPHIPGAKPGDLIYKDVNEDGKITSDDQVRKYISSIPEITYGLSANFGWKGFELDIFFQGQARAGMINNYTDTGNRFKYLFDQRWTQDNPSTKYPRMFKQSDPYNYPSTYHLENASFIRLKNAEIAYNLNYLKGIPDLFNDIRLFIRGSNLFTISPIKYFDPETTSSDMKYFPQTMTITGGITIALQ